MKKWFPIIALILCINLASCSRIRLAYNNADWLLAYQVDSLFDLNSAQTKKLDQILDRLHDWHKTEELPRVIELISNAQNRVSGDITEEDIDWIYAEFKSMRLRIADLIAEDLSLLIAELEPSQVDHLEKHLIEHSKEHDEEYQQPEKKWLEQKQESLLETLTEWFGEISDDQKTALFQAYSFDRELDYQHFLHNQQRQQQILDQLRSNLPPEKIKEELVALFVDPHSQQSPDEQRLDQLMTQKRIQFYHFLNQTITPEQRQTLIDNLEGYKQEFLKIHGSAS